MWRKYGGLSSDSWCKIRWGRLAQGWEFLNSVLPSWTPKHGCFRDKTIPSWLQDTVLYTTASLRVDAMDSDSPKKSHGVTVPRRNLAMTRNTHKPRFSIYSSKQHHSPVLHARIPYLFSLTFTPTTDPTFRKSKLVTKLKLLILNLRPCTIQAQLIFRVRNALLPMKHYTLFVHNTRNLPVFSYWPII